MILGAVSEQAKANKRAYNRAYMAARRAEDPELFRARWREGYARDPEKYKAKVRAYRASLTPEEARVRARRILLRSKYGIDPGQFDAMRVAQEYRCVICGRHENEIPKPRKGDHSSLVPDHDHETGVVRALICNPCNIMIGHAREDEEVLLAAVDYLRKHRQ